jgi:tetratricopeptide (TPR) repeat protein
MKKLNGSILIFLLIISFSLKADEGMWLPNLIKAMNYSDMQSKGLMISAEDLYSVNKSSIKDAVVHFNGGCTAEVVSSKGLVFTNHHCGYGQIASHSTPETNYLRDGFWAKNFKEELESKNLYVDFIIRIEDVTNQIIPNGDETNGAIKINIAGTSEQLIAGSNYKSIIKPFNYGNKYFAFIYERYTDIRLVGAPPSSVGKFGFDTDNWVWPRHTGDFSIFRIYADKNNNPADYSIDNVPYTPKHFLPISIEGVKEGDFTMIYGFPGSTEQFLTSYAVDQKINRSNPAQIAMRDKALDAINATMKTSEAMRIRFAPLQSRVSNYWKKMQGENFGLTRVKAIEQKQEFEAEFEIEINKNPELKEKYGNLLSEFKSVYENNQEYTKAYDYYIELIYSGPSSLKYFITFEKLIENFEKLNDKQLTKEKERVIKAHSNMIAALDIQKNHEIKMWKSMFTEALTHVDKKFHPDYLVSCSDVYSENFDKIVDEIFKESVFLNDDSFEKMINSLNSKKVKKLKADKGYALISSFYKSIRQKVVPQYYANEAKIEILMKQYVTAITEVFPNKQYWYDANNTMRLTYGKIDGSSPKDGMKYKAFTTAEGILQKYIPNNDEFDVPEKLINLIKNKNYGRYGVDSTLYVCFTGTNHTTGGNSGSPVLNAKGHLIGINFDRSWESTMSDVMYSSELCRNITVDIRYLLFIVDKYAGATNLIDELVIIEKEDPLKIKREALKRETEIFSKLINSSPNQADLFFKRGKAYYELGELRLALKDYTKSAEIEPKKEHLAKRNFIQNVLEQIESIKE